MSIECRGDCLYNFLYILYHTEALQATVSEGPAQGPYVAARLGFQPLDTRHRAPCPIIDQEQDTKSFKDINCLPTLESFS